MATHDSIVEALRWHGRTFADVADVLDLSPEWRQWLAGKRLDEPADERHGRALCDNRLMVKELKLPRVVRLAIIRRRHYDDSTDMPLNILRSNVSPTAKLIADEYEAWLRSDDDRLARHLKSLA